MTPAMISACEEHAIAVVASAHPDVPILMTGQAVPRGAKVYVRFWVLPSDESMPVGVGQTAKSRNVGIVQADVYGPKDRGGGETGEVAETIAKAFHRYPLEVTDEGWVVFRDATFVDLGDEKEEHRQMMRVPYKYDYHLVTTS